MGMSKRAIEKAYEVFGAIKKEVLPELELKSWPTDYVELDEEEKESPRLYEVYGCDKKADGGWECLMFFMPNPPNEDVLRLFDELKGDVPNSSMSGPSKLAPHLYRIGWF